MRTTINLDEDVLQKSRELAARLNRPFRVVVNEALRPGINLDTIHELLAQVEGEDHR